MKYFLFIIILFIISCDPVKDVPKISKTIYKGILKFMDESSEPPPAVREFINKIKKDSLSS